ncbi:MAG: bifunctional serine/threonine-protein kinase/formylglycine-generating enzyme family protein [Deltaproteobacteria bacterium]|nr:bifunctional serine/threonine-protein kinase/formylglycine-generating enzyme family protein [Deltaproteobacteria bacterium]
MIKELGRGGMGVVYRAQDTMLGREVALKRVLATGNRMVIDRFLGEAKSIAALNHPNIIQIFDMGEDEEGLFIVTEFVDGSDLFNLLKTQKILPPNTALKLIVPIIRAMAYAHKQGVIHRDIKPANVLLTSDGIPKIADFGLARTEAMKDAEVTGMVMGTQNYASPEQFSDSKHVDHRTDVYSIGAMFFEMLSGTRPQFLREQDIPDPFKPIVTKATAADRGARYQRLEEMLRDLHAVTKGGTATVPHATARSARGPVSDDAEMALIPAGPFPFGPQGEPQQLPAFYIDVYPVTNLRFARVFREYQFPPGLEDHPAAGVTWLQAARYAKLVGKRLPTEPEWEKAARGPEGWRFPWGNTFMPQNCNCFESGIGRTTAVSTYPAGQSPYGVMDLAGNVWEWTATRLDKLPQFRILKGGAFDGKAQFTQCFEKFAHREDGLIPTSGFRCARSAEK